MSADIGVDPVSVDISCPYSGGPRASNITVWLQDHATHRAPEMRGRMTLAIHTGTAVVHLRPTRDEALHLIDALTQAVERPLQVVA